MFRRIRKHGRKSSSKCTENMRWDYKLHTATTRLRALKRNFSALRGNGTAEDSFFIKSIRRHTGRMSHKLRFGHQPHRTRPRARPGNTKVLRVAFLLVLQHRLSRSCQRMRRLVCFMFMFIHTRDVAACERLTANGDGELSRGEGLSVVSRVPNEKEGEDEADDDERLSPAYFQALHGHGGGRKRNKSCGRVVAAI